MTKTTVSVRGCVSVVLALVVFCAGLYLILLGLIVGAGRWTLGLVFCFGALFISGSRKVWQCPACGTLLDRV